MTPTAPPLLPPADPDATFAALWPDARRYATAASNWRIGGGDDAAPLLDAIEARPDHGDGLTLDEADGFDRLLSLVRPQDRGVLTARFRDGGRRPPSPSGSACPGAG